MTVRVLLIGYNDGLLAELDRVSPPIAVTVVEEPDVWSARGLAPKAATHPALTDVCFARYQQDDQYLERLADIGAVDAVAPGTEYGVPAAAQAAVALGLPGPGVRAASILRDKLLLREVTAAAGMPTPRFREVRSAHEVAEFAQGGACVVKPSARQASLGVLLLDPGADLVEAWRECTEAEEPGQVAQRPMSWRYMVEERIYGPEYSTECLVAGGKLLFLNVTRKRVLPGRHPVELGHVVPGAAGDDEQSIWTTAVGRLVEATAMDTGMLHAEWIRTATGPMLVECGARAPGDRILDLIDVAYETNLASAWLHLLANRPEIMPAEPVRGAAIHFLVASAGVIDTIDGADAAQNSPGVHEVALRLPPGHVIRDVTSSWDRVGSVIAVGDDAVTAERRAVRAAQKITVRMV